MARFSCKCGNILSISSCPNDVQLRVYTDKEYIGFWRWSMCLIFRCPNMTFGCAINAREYLYLMISK